MRDKGDLKHNFTGMKKSPSDGVRLEAILQPETETERKILLEEDLRQGLFWGVPRFGHPEGEVYKHIREVLDNIDKLEISRDDRARLRLIAFAHDAFKYKEDKSHPRDWSKHHGVYARRFMEKYTDDEGTLKVTELHDEAYYAWRHKHLYHQNQEGDERLQRLLDAMGEDIQLYYLFFKCDTQTGDKNQAPLKWFEMVVEEIDVVPSLW